MRCKTCGSFAINPHSYGRDPDDALDLCDVCYWRAMVAREREACAVTAWFAGMDYHERALGLPCDAREVGSSCANAIRERGKS